jgi:hypothetical protein
MSAKIIFQVKSGAVKRGDIATLRGDMGRENAALAVLITLEEPSKPMTAEAKAAGQYRHEDMGRRYDKFSIATVQEIIEQGKRLEIPMSLEVLAAAEWGFFLRTDGIALGLAALFKRVHYRPLSCLCVPQGRPINSKKTATASRKFFRNARRRH